MENLDKALEAQAKAFDNDKITVAEEKKQERLVAAAAEKDSKLIDAEIEAITKDIESQIKIDREEEEKRRADLEKASRIVYTEDHTVKEMKAEAKARGISGYSKMKEAELIKVLNA